MWNRFLFSQSNKKNFVHLGKWDKLTFRILFGDTGVQLQCMQTLYKEYTEYTTKYS